MEPVTHNCGHVDDGYKGDGGAWKSDTRGTKDMLVVGGNAADM